MLSLISALVVGGDAHELELILAEGVGLMKTSSEQWTNENLAMSRDRCHVTLIGSDDAHLAPYFVSSDNQFSHSHPHIDHIQTSTSTDNKKCLKIAARI